MNEVWTEFHLAQSDTAETSPDDIHNSVEFELLRHHPVWLINLRWAPIFFLFVFGLVGFATTGDHLNLSPVWPLAVAFSIAALNGLFILHLNLCGEDISQSNLRINIWMQMIADIVALTFVIHFLGTLETFAVFMYLFHIFLACMLLRPSRSLIVVVIASASFVLCFALEASGVILPRSIFANVETLPRTTLAAYLNVSSALAIWFVMWLMISGLSARFRTQSAELSRINTMLVNAQDERASHMLRTTHEMKAPFAAIHANTQLLLKGYCGKINDKAKTIIEKISVRSRKLTREIQEMLQLANLTSDSGDLPEAKLISMPEIIGKSISHISSVASERQITIKSECDDINCIFPLEHMRILLDNLCTNAVIYSHPGSEVSIICTKHAESQMKLCIKDNGIGIEADKLPRIFDEYYRTDEAVEHNKESTGLGMSILRKISHLNGVSVSVKSCKSVGTEFVLIFDMCKS